MAKLSKNSPMHNGGTESSEFFQHLLSEMKDILLGSNADPVNHIPLIDIFSTSDAVVVEVELPGVRPDDIEVLFHDNVLTIKGAKQEDFDEEKVHYVCMERSFGNLLRTVKIPCPINANGIHSIFNNGVLTIKLPKLEERRSGKRKIPVEME